MLSLCELGHCGSLFHIGFCVRYIFPLHARYILILLVMANHCGQWLYRLLITMKIALRCHLDGKLLWSYLIKERSSRTDIVRNEWLSCRDRETWLFCRQLIWLRELGRLFRSFVLLSFFLSFTHTNCHTYLSFQVRRFTLHTFPCHVRRFILHTFPFQVRRFILQIPF